MIYLDITTVEGCVTNTRVTLVSGEFLLSCCDQRIRITYKSGDLGGRVMMHLRKVAGLQGKAS